MSIEEGKDLLQSLYRIEDKLDEIVGVLRLQQGEAIEAAKRRAFARSTLRRRIYELCDGSRSVGQIANSLGRPIQQISNNIAMLRDHGLVKEVRSGKAKYYMQVR
jgi:DNA-binding transcriptional ArsR family regulator